MKTLSYILTICIGFILGFALRECTDERCPEVIETIDSTRKKLPPVTKETVKPKPIKTIKHKNPPITELIKDTVNIKELLLCNDINVYSDTLTDSSGTIISRDSVRGELLKKQITFIPNFLTVTITNVVEKKVDRSAFLIGLEAGSSFSGQNPIFRLAPEVEYLIKQGYAFSYNYDLINNFHSVGVKKRLKL